MIDLERISFEQEERFHQLLTEEIKKSSLYPEDNGSYFAKRSIERLNDELFLIHQQRWSKNIWLIYILLKEAKKHNEPYVIRNSTANLYVLYVLGLTYFNPIFSACYQSCLGSKRRPKHSLTIDISFSKKFTGYLLKDFCKTALPGFVIYPFSSCFYKNASSQRIAIPESIDINDYFEETRNKRLSFVSPKLEDMFLCSEVVFIFDILKSSGLTTLSNYIKKYGQEEYADARYDYHDITKENPSLGKMYLNLISFYGTDNDIFIESLMRCVTKSRSMTNRHFSNREDVFNYAVNELHLNEDDAYDLMEDVRTGKTHFTKPLSSFLESIISDDYLEEINDICYLPPWGYISQGHYNRALLARYICIKKEESKIKKMC